MKIRHSGKSIIKLNRGNLTIAITPGDNILPDYDWLSNIIAKNKDLEYITEVKFTTIGTIANESKVLNKDKAVAKVELKDTSEPEVVNEDTPEPKKEKPEPKKRKRRRKAEDSEKDE